MFTILTKTVKNDFFTFPAGTEHEVKSTAGRSHTRLFLDITKSVEGGVGVIEQTVPDSSVTLPYHETAKQPE